MQETTLIVARHGNTFLSGQIPTRVGVRTDLPLVEKEKGLRIGSYLKDNNLIPDIIYTSCLTRTIQTAMYAIKAMGLKEIPIIISERFNEIDYGIDENKTEDEVCYRLGFDALNDANVSSSDIISKGKEIINEWNTNAVVPSGWLVDVEKIINDWKDFVKEIESKYKGKKILVVTSNGIIKFLPHITKSYKECYEKYGTRLKTGGLTLFSKNDNMQAWECLGWGL